MIVSADQDSSHGLLPGEQVPVVLLRTTYKQKVTLRELCSQDRVTVEPQSKAAHSRRYLSLEHIKSGTGELMLALDPVSEEEGRSSTFAFDERHVLYGKLRPYLNKVALPDFAGRCTTELIPLLPAAHVDRGFLAWVLRCPDTVNWAMRGTTGSRMPRAEIDELLAMPVFVPSQAEQRRIAAMLNAQMQEIERARGAVQAQLDSARAFPAAFLRSVFESEQAHSWRRQKLGDIATTIQNGLYKGAEHYRSGQPFVRMYNVSDKTWRMNLDTLAEVEVKESERKAFALHVGDLLVSRVNSAELVGKCAWVGPDAEGFMFENMLIRVRLSDEIDSLFVAQQMMTAAVRKQIRRVAKQAVGQASINSEDLRSLELAFPSLNEQRAISTRLDSEFSAVHLLCSSLETRLAEIERLPAALLREAFSPAS